MAYSGRMKKICRPIEFGNIVEAAREALPPDVRRVPWMGLEHGIVPLDTEQKLDQYLAAYGKMHLEKMRMTLDSLDDPIKDIGDFVSVVDWGCGQALATCAFFDWLCTKEIDANIVRRVHLIEPSELALARATVHVEAYKQQYVSDLSIHQIKKFINDVSGSDFDIKGVSTTIHLFSNILDIETIDIDELAELIKHTFIGRQIFCCVSPLNQSSGRIVEFAQKFGITQGDVLAACTGRLKSNRGTVSMLAFIIDDSSVCVKYVEFVPEVKLDINEDKALQRVVDKYKPDDSVLSRIVQFFLMSTDLERMKEPKIKTATSFTFVDKGNELYISFIDNAESTNESGKNTEVAGGCEKFIEDCRRNADAVKTKFPKDLHFALNVAWDGREYPLLYFIKPFDELKEFDFEKDGITLLLRDFSVSVGCAEALQLADEKVNALENFLRSDDVSLKALGKKVQEVIGMDASLCTRNVYVALSDKDIALAQIYSELKRLKSTIIERNSLLKAFLLNSEFKNELDSEPVLHEGLIKVVPMDENQRKAVAHALNHRISVVVGPPGCGKTQLILNLLANALVRGKKVLVASKNNKAVDNVKDRFEKFDEAGCFLRFGKKTYMNDIVVPHLSGLLNCVQEVCCGDDDYNDTLQKFEKFVECLKDKKTLEEELVVLESKIRTTDQQLKQLNSELDKVRKDEANVVSKVSEEIRERLEYRLLAEIPREIETKRSEIKRATSNLCTLKEQKCRIETEVRENALRRIEKECEECRKNQREQESAIEEMSESISIKKTELAKICASAIDTLDDVASDEINKCVSRLNQLRTKVECSTSGIIERILVLIKGPGENAKKVLDTVAEFPFLIRSYLKKEDKRGSVSDFRTVSEVVDYCKRLQQGLEKVLEHRENLKKRREHIEFEVAGIEQKIERARKAIEDLNAKEDYLCSCRQDKEAFDVYVRQEYGSQIDEKKRQNQRTIQNIEAEIKDVREKIAVLEKEKIELSELPAEEDEFAKFVQRYCEYGKQIEDQRADFKIKVNKIMRAIEKEEGNLKENGKFIQETNSKLDAISDFLENVSDVEFGRKFVRATLNHYLHSKDSAKAIAAFKRYLPDSIPWRSEDMPAFVEAVNRFIDVFRLMSVTSLSVKSSFPLKDDLFDILIIDEASQCDVASALPLILRAKQVVVIGDPKQLKHISKVEPEEELAIKRHLKLSGVVHLKYADASLWDYARDWLPWCENAKPCVLENHYRCHADIIGYSNEIFYSTLTFGGLTVRTPRCENWELSEGIKWVDIKGRQQSNSINVNVEEVKASVDIAVKLAKKSLTASIGIVTPFKVQAERINECIPAELRERVVVDTVHKFQGDEKDVMIYSLVVTDNSPDSKIRWIDYKVPNLVNVAVTRAKHLLVIVGNKDYIKRKSNRSCPLGHLVEYVDKLQAQ